MQRFGLHLYTMQSDIITEQCIYLYLECVTTAWFPHCSINGNSMRFNCMCMRAAYYQHSSCKPKHSFDKCYPCMNSNLLALFGSWCTSDLGSSAAAVNSHKSISMVNSKEISQLTCADGRWIDPVRCFVPFALCPRGSMKFVAFVTVEHDSASNSIVCHMRTIASIVRTTWWITH